MKAWIFALVPLLVTNGAFGQNLSSISGKVVDATTKEALPGANVYLATTSIGISANETGAFTLTEIPSGKYDFIVSMLGYTSYSKPILFSGHSIENVIIALQPATIQLNAVTVQARKEKQNRYYYSLFEKSFLGTTVNASRCKILNPYDIFVYKDKDKIIALASKPIIIENKALGYKVYCELKEFEIENAIHSLVMSGISRFEELIPESDKQKQRWIKERDRAYYGSIPHFLLSLKNDELYPNYFKINDAGGNPMTKLDLMKDSLIRYKGSVYLTYEKEYPENGYPRYKTGNQSSEIIFYGKPVMVYSNGFFDDYHSLTFLGYLGWTYGMAELVPLGYQPTYPLKRK